MQLGPLLLPGPKKLDGPAWADAYECTKTTDFKGVPSDFSALSGEFDSVGEALGPRRVRQAEAALRRGPGVRLVACERQKSLRPLM
jgi:hypothetical protein